MLIHKLAIVNLLAVLARLVQRLVKASTVDFQYGDNMLIGDGSWTDIDDGAG
jgi:hypothetical protein